MILRTKYGKDFNNEKIWAVEIGIVIDWDAKNKSFKSGDIYWSYWNKYKSQRAMLQALKKLKENEGESTARVSTDDGKTYKKVGHPFRPVHVDYSYEMKNISVDSLRRCKLEKLLDKN